MLRSVRARVIALAIGVAVVTAVATGWLATTAAERAVRSSAERSLEVDTSILQSLSAYAASTGTWDGVEPLVGELAVSTGRRIALTDAEGLLLVDSDQVLGDTPRALPAAPVARLDPFSASLSLPTLAVSVDAATMPAPTAEELAAVTGCLDAAGVAYVVDDFGGGSEVLPIDVLNDAMFRSYAQCTVVLNSPGIEIATSGDAGTVTQSVAEAPTALLYLGTRDQGTLLFQGPTATRTIWLLAAVVATAALIAWLLGRRLTRPLAQLTGAAQRMESGDLTRRVVVASRDEVGALGHAFNSLADSLQRTELLRQRMVTDIAHELRNPLVTLGGTLEAIQDGIYPTSPDVIASLAEETAHLQRLVGDLHELSVADSVGVRLDRQPVEPLALVHAVVEAHRSLATSANVALHESPHGGDDCPELRLDAGRIRQALSNLLGNAIRHASTAVTVTVVRPVDVPGVVRITVSDDGPGIPAEHLEDVFERFWRADSARARSTGGTGLGLAISRELVLAHGGELTAQSTVGHGATFTITLPIE
jgi:two-component system, OmpR family, sensor histidine kinase BaeS